MALLHEAELVPSKVELVAAWAPGQTWFDGDASGEFVRVGTFRFDDPEGEVGVETLLVTAGDGPVLQVPLTYRNGPLAGAEEWLIGTLEHSVLGTRWVYDAVGDPVYLGELAKAVLEGGHQVDQYYEVEGGRRMVEPTARVAGSGSADSTAPSVMDAHAPATRSDRSTTLVETDALAFLIARVPLVHPLPTNTGSQTLTATWTTQPEPAVLALVSHRA